MRPLGIWGNIAWEAERGMMKWLWTYSEGKFWYSSEGPEKPRLRKIGADFDPGNF
jgi:hypothetical protein